MIHQYQLGGYNIVLDICSGAVHVVDEVAYDIIAMYKDNTPEQIVSEITAKYPEVTAQEVSECIEDIGALENAGKLFTPDTFAPDAIAVEELFFNSNAKTAIMVGQARGVAVLACVNGGLEINEYTPLQIKQALVGYGRADKKQVQAMVKAILNLREVPKPDDTADAVAAAICHGHAAGNRVRKVIGK